MTDFLNALYGRAPEPNDWPDSGKQRKAPARHGPGEPGASSAPTTEEDLAPWRRANDAFIAEIAASAERVSRRARVRPVLPLMDGEETLPVTPFGPRAPTGSPDDRAARATGVSRTYLRSLSGKESRGDDDAEAGSSSATGRAQFIDSTWLDMLREHGPRYGLDAETFANMPNEEALELRRDAQWSELMAAEYAMTNEALMRGRLNRPLTEGEVYLGHWLGPDKAVSLLRARPDAIASQIVGDAAFRANMPVFYTEGARFQQVRDERGRIRFEYLGGGRLRTARQVIDAQTANFTRDEFRLEPRGINLSRPRIENGDGSFSTERTITIEADGRWFNIPTIVDGRQRTEDEAVRLWRSGENAEVGAFGSLSEAEQAARARSDRIGRARR